MFDVQEEKEEEEGTVKVSLSLPKKSVVIGPSDIEKVQQTLWLAQHLVMSTSSMLEIVPEDLKHTAFQGLRRAQAKKDATLRLSCMSCVN